ncbi:MAG: TVP38/TMEM64 family protein [Deltaproteobacteria bacterium]|nr:TVP38/TMEM64 family protein [Deltaproteobacteria bacterium]
MNRGLIKKLIIVALFVGAAIIFRVYHFEQYLSLQYVKDSKEQFVLLYAQHQFLVIGAYFLIYVLVTGFSLPGATVMTLAGGALFGFWIGLITVSFASSIGATLACIVARFVLRDWVQRKFHDKLKPINEGVEREGAFYLFTLRLVPLFPFFIINMAMGLTRMPIKTYYWVSQVGMLAGTAVYVNAGKELSKLDSLSGILSPSLLISFAILGVFPITVKKLLGMYRGRVGKPASIS